MGDRKALLIFLGITAVGIGIAYSIIKPENRLPIYQPGDINPALVDKDMRDDEGHRISDFELVNQMGDTVSLENASGKILVVDFFFARCQTICPVMNQNMAELQESLGDADDILLLSHSVTPQIDSVSVLIEYGERFGADPEKWWLLTGPKAHIYELARRSYFAVLDEGDGGLQDFIHTENVVLVDPDGRLRGFYDGTSDYAMAQLFSDIGLLREEYDAAKAADANYSD